jgi:hypothetical protein
MIGRLFADDRIVLTRDMNCCSLYLHASPLLIRLFKINHNIVCILGKEEGPSLFHSNIL